MNDSVISDALQKYTYAFAIWTDKADFILDKSSAHFMWVIWRTWRVSIASMPTGF